ncbi:hypothetical protein ABZ871_11185 [Streptomyces populi]
MLFIEAGSCTEEAVLIAAEFDKCVRFFQRQETDTDGIEKPLWRTRWPAPACDECARLLCWCIAGWICTGQEAAEFGGGCPRITVEPGPVGELFRPGMRVTDGYHLEVTVVEACRSAGTLRVPGGLPAVLGPDVGRGGEPRITVLVPSGEYVSEKARARHGGEQYLSRPGRLFRGRSGRPSYPHLCEGCQDRVVAAEQRAEPDERERQEQEAAEPARVRRRPAAGPAAPDRARPAAGGALGGSGPPVGAEAPVVRAAPGGMAGVGGPEFAPACDGVRWTNLPSAPARTASRSPGSTSWEPRRAGVVRGLLTTSRQRSPESSHHTRRPA